MGEGRRWENIDHGEMEKFIKKELVNILQRLEMIRPNPGKNKKEFSQIIKDIRAIKPKFLKKHFLDYEKEKKVMINLFEGLYTFLTQEFNLKKKVNPDNLNQKTEDLFDLMSKFKNDVEEIYENIHEDLS
jgi:hypothetical protein